MSIRKSIVVLPCVPDGVRQRQEYWLLLLPSWHQVRPRYFVKVWYLVNTFFVIRRVLIKHDTLTYFTFSCSWLMISVRLRPSICSWKTHMRTVGSNTSECSWTFCPMTRAIADPLQQHHVKRSSHGTLLSLPIARADYCYFELFAHEKKARKRVEWYDFFRFGEFSIFRSSPLVVSLRMTENPYIVMTIHWSYIICTRKERV